MTFIVVPHEGDTRSYELSYRTVRWLAMAGGAVALLLISMMVSWLWITGQAARVPLLQREIATLRRERARVEELSRMVVRLEAQYQQVRALLGADAPRDTLPNGAAAPPQLAKPSPTDSPQASLPRRWPLAATTRSPWFVTQGVRGPGGATHPGLDIAVAEGTPIRAAGAGTILEAREDSVLGRFVRIRHADGWESTYAHASRLLVQRRQRVRNAQVIALSGSTGRSTAPHLHFELRKDGSPVDPRSASFATSN